MPNDMPGVPNDIYKWENMFDYSVWTPDTIVRCCSVPWDASYRDIVRFSSDDERDKYFEELANNSYSFTIGGENRSNFVYLRYGQPIHVPTPFSMINQTNYLIVSNPTQQVPAQTGQGVPPNIPDTFYYFITDVQFIAPNCTQISVQLDVWQTYYKRVKWGVCYINKGHLGIANANSTIDNLAEYMTDTEGLDIGDEYEIINQQFISFQDTSQYVVVMSSADLTSPFGDVEDAQLNTARGSKNDGMPCGSACYAFTGASFLRLMDILHDKPWISQCIQLITVVPRVFCQVDAPTEIAGVPGLGYTLSPFGFDDGSVYEVPDLFDNYRIPDRYKHLFKFYTFPYTFLEMTALNGGEIILKNECMRTGVLPSGSKGTRIKTRSICAPPDIRGYVFPEGYNASSIDNDRVVSYKTPFGDDGDTLIYAGEGFDIALGFSNFPQLSLVNNSYINYLASTANQRNYEFASANWSQQKAQMGYNLAYNQATSGINTGLQNQNISNQANYAMADIQQERNAYQGATGVIGNAIGAAGSLATGNILGAATGAYNAAQTAYGTALNADWINRQTSTQVGAATATAQNSANNQRYVRDTNQEYAQFASKGDYENAIQGIQAKVQDAKLLQPSTAGQNGGDAFNLGNGYCGILLKWKRLKTNYMTQVGDFWLKYGYYVNRWYKPNDDLKCMSNFTYWKMQNASLQADMPELFAEAIRGIFEKGVTVWSDPNKINMINVTDNEIVGGIVY